eukprot:1161401-Pelagomonas_calceolata.AAC.1
MFMSSHGRGHARDEQLHPKKTIETFQVHLPVGLHIYVFAIKGLHHAHGPDTWHSEVKSCRYACQQGQLSGTVRPVARPGQYNVQTFEYGLQRKKDYACQVRPRALRKGHLSCKAGPHHTD